MFQWPNAAKDYFVTLRIKTGYGEVLLKRKSESAIALDNVTAMPDEFCDYTGTGVSCHSYLDQGEALIFFRVKGEQ